MTTFNFTYGSFGGKVIARNRAEAIRMVRDTYGFGHGDITIAAV